MSIYKQGSTIKILLEFTEEEFAAIYPNEEFLAEAEQSGEAEYTLTPTFDPENFTVLLRADSTGWKKGPYKADIKVVKNGDTFYIPDKTYIEFQVIMPVSEVGSEVNT